MVIIGILAQIDNEKETKISNTYIRALESCGAVPIVLPYTDNENTLNEFINICDGFLFSGGCDIAPERYGERPSMLCGESQPYRDEFELSIFERAYRSGKPIMGICRGEQLINVALGGTLYQDIPSEVNTSLLHSQSEPKHLPSHRVLVKEGTPLYELLGKEFIAANSFHHQAVKELGKNLEIMALSDDGIVEAVYLRGEQYIRAYQWHPERLSYSDDKNKMLFEDFIKAALDNKK